MNYTPFTDYQEIRIVSSADGGVIYTTPYKALISIELLGLVAGITDTEVYFLSTNGVKINLLNANDSFGGAIGGCVLPSGTQIRLSTAGTSANATFNIHVFRLN